MCTAVKVRVPTSSKGPKFPWYELIPILEEELMLMFRILKPSAASAGHSEVSLWGVPPYVRAPQHQGLFTSPDRRQTRCSFPPWVPDELVNSARQQPASEAEDSCLREGEREQKASKSRLHFMNLSQNKTRTRQFGSPACLHHDETQLNFEKTPLIRAHDRHRCATERCRPLFLGPANYI